jgi:hypothetical protein
VKRGRGDRAAQWRGGAAAVGFCESSIKVK